MAQLTFHVKSAMEVASTILKSTPHQSVWRDKMVTVADTLNYINQSTTSLHSSGYNYNVFMDEFFNYHTSTGLVQHGPPTKRKRSSTSTLSVPPEEEQQTPEEETATVFQATHQPIKQEKYNYDCYNVDINLPVYYTFTKAAQAPPKNTCYCGMNFPQATELEQHKSVVHKTKGYSCSKCGKSYRDNRGTWKHFRVQHLQIYTHMCQVAGCTLGPEKGVYGNDDQTLVWKHMDKNHGVKSPLGCPKCNKTFSSIKYQVPHVKKCEELLPKQTKEFGCDQCSKRYMTQKALDGHQLFHQGLAENFICDICGAEYKHKTSLTSHMKGKHPDEVGEEEEEEVVELE